MASIFSGCVRGKQSGIGERDGGRDGTDRWSVSGSLYDVIGAASNAMCRAFSSCFDRYEHTAGANVPI